MLFHLPFGNIKLALYYFQLEVYLGVGLGVGRLLFMTHMCLSAIVVFIFSCLRSFTVESAGNYTSLNVNDYIFVGGSDDLAQSQRRTNVQTGFTGCILMLQMQGIPFRWTFSHLFLLTFSYYNILWTSYWGNIQIQLKLRLCGRNSDVTGIVVS